MKSSRITRGLMGSVAAIALCAGLVGGATAAGARGDWGQASAAVRQQVVDAINWSYPKGSPVRVAECFWVETSASHPRWATATFWSGMPDGCDPSDGFGVQAFRYSAGMWLRVAWISGGQGARCVYSTRPSTAALAALKSAGICR